MACQVEVMAGNDIEIGGKSHLSSECDLEITSLHNLKEKLLNGNENGNISINFEEAGSSTAITNGNEIAENGHDKLDTDSEVDIELTLTPKKSGKAKKGKKIASKRTPSKKESATEEITDSQWQEFGFDYQDNISDDGGAMEVENDLNISEDNCNIELTPKKSSPSKKGKREQVSPKSNSRRSKKVEAIEQELTDQSLENVDLNYKDDDEESTIDVVNDDPVERAEDNYASQSQESGKSSDKQSQESDTVFARLRNSMRFSVSPKKQAENTVREHSLRGISGRKALHQTSSSLEPTASRKRKSEIDSSESPQKKCFITTFSEHSPGWKFFTSPFHKYLSPNKSGTEAASSTPMRKLHEDMESMVVNASGTIVGNLLEVDESQVTTSEEKIEIDKKSELKDPESNWKCIVM